MSPLENHWAVSINSENKLVLVQLQEKGEQVRVGLTMEEARAFSMALSDAIHHLKFYT